MQYENLFNLFSYSLYYIPVKSLKKNLEVQLKTITLNFSCLDTGRQMHTDG